MKEPVIMKRTKIKFANRNHIFVIICAIFVLSGIISGFALRTVISAQKVYLHDADVPNGIKMSVIMYHSITNDLNKISDYAISTDQFEKDIKYLKDNGYNFINTEDLKNYMYHDIPLPLNPVMITFDDGFYDNYINALPVLKKYNAKSVISPIAKVCDEYTKNSDKNASYAYMDWDTVSEISKNGLTVFENHSYNMHSTSKRKGCAKIHGESVEEYQKILYDDLLKAHNLIYKHTGRHPVAIVYPFGSTSKEAYEVITSLGYIMSFSCTEGINVITKNPKCLFMLKRFNRTPQKSSAEFFSDKLG